jgi:23S rRNA (pseudouridine1915-N3)-methyltransferase
MLTIGIICVGSVKESYFTQALAHYQKRLTPYCKLQIFEIAEEPLRGENPPQIEAALQKEGEIILKKMEGAVNFALCIEGKACSSEELATLLQKAPHTFGKSHINFIIGSSHGLCQKVKEASQMCLSFGAITLPHQLMRVVLLEQIYRAFGILANTKYHK